MSAPPAHRWQGGVRNGKFAAMPGHDAMICRSCGNEERASEGYPCTNCGTFICQLCSIRGVTLCAQCSGQDSPVAPGTEETPAAATDDAGSAPDAAPDAGDDPGASQYPSWLQD
jgi:hypothetical protein